MEEAAARRAAEVLLAEHKTGAPFGPFPPGDGPATISDAYDIQDRLVFLLRRQHGQIVGYKVGLTSAPMQTFCGINHPIAGAVLERRVYPTRTASLPRSFRRRSLQMEIAVRINPGIPAGQPPHTVATILAHID